MTCNHNFISSPVSIDLCYTEKMYDCGCDEDDVEIVVCGQCGQFKVVQVNNVCTECDGGDIHVWDDELNVWQEPSNYNNLAISTEYLEAYNSAQPSITNAEFMIKGYHYTKPTSPSRTDSARLYIDTNINGEESSIITGDYNWIKYKISGTISENSTVNFKGYLPANFWTSTQSIYPKDLNGNDTTTIYFAVFSGHTLTSLYVDGGIVAPGGRMWSDINITGSGTYSYTHPTYGTEYKFTLTEVNFGNKWVTPTTGICSESYLLHLKGFHNFYIKTDGKNQIENKSQYCIDTSNSSTYPYQIILNKAPLNGTKINIADSIEWDHSGGHSFVNTSTQFTAGTANTTQKTLTPISGSSINITFTYDGNKTIIINGPTSCHTVTIVYKYI